MEIRYNNYRAKNKVKRAKAEKEEEEDREKVPGSHSLSNKSTHLQHYTQHTQTFQKKKRIALYVRGVRTEWLNDTHASAHAASSFMMRLLQQKAIEDEEERSLMSANGPRSISPSPSP